MICTSINTPLRFIFDKCAAKQLCYNNCIFLSGSTKSFLYQLHIWCDVSPHHFPKLPHERQQHLTLEQNEEAAVVSLSSELSQQEPPTSLYPSLMSSHLCKQSDHKDEQGQIGLIRISSRINKLTDSRFDSSLFTPPMVVPWLCHGCGRNLIAH